jgi:hypothetical protein
VAAWRFASFSTWLGHHRLDQLIDLHCGAVVEGFHQAELVSVSAKGRRASFSACVSRAVLSIIPWFLLVIAAPALRQRIEQKANVG